MLCSYNGARFIDAQLSSIFGGELPPDELVICDDHSNDETVAIAEKWRLRYPNVVRLIRNEANLGISQNFEQGLILCSGDIVFLCDQDDLWDPSKLRRFLAEFDRRPRLMLLFSDAQLVDSDGAALPHSLFEAHDVTRDEARQIHGGAAFPALLRRNLVTGATAAFRREILQGALPLPRQWVHDEWLAAISAAIGQVDLLPEKLIDYRQHSHNQIGMRKRTFIEKLRSSLAPRVDFHLQRARRTEILLERLRALGPAIASEYLTITEEKLCHHLARARLPKNRMARVAPIAEEALSGRYARYSSGIRSIVRDIVG